MLYDKIIDRKPIEKGWSGDKKYFVTTDDGSNYLLRISPAERFEQKRLQHERMMRVAALGIPMCQPVEFGVCEEGVYSLQSWIDGEDAEAVVKRFPAKQQYRYGLDAGRILSQIHTIPAPSDLEDWASRFGRKIDRKIKMYTDCDLKYPGGDAFLAHIQASRHLLSGRPQTYQHGDHHIGNMMIDTSGKLILIDFDRDDHGDPWEEFNRIVWCAQYSPAFASGMVDGYFDGAVPLDFWSLLALYICSNTLGSLPWAIPYGEQQVQIMQDQAAQILEWYDHFRKVIPNWYHKEVNL